MLHTKVHLDESVHGHRVTPTERRSSLADGEPASASKHLRAVERSVAHMREHFSHHLTLDALASVAAMSKFHFARVFEQLTGTPPRCFLACLRIEQAKRLLYSTDMPVTDICLEVGYTSLGTFSQAFSDIVGMAPSAYRKLSNETLDPLIFLGRCSAFLATQRRPLPTDLMGIVESPEDAEASVIFVGAFSRGVPLGRPQSGTVLLRAGSFQIRRPTSSNFHLLAVRLPVRGLAQVAGTALEVSGVASYRFARSPSISEDLPRLRLRPSTPIDPPLLVEFSALI